MLSPEVCTAGETPMTDVINRSAVGSVSTRADHHSDSEYIGVFLMVWYLKVCSQSGIL